MGGSKPGRRYRSLPYDALEQYRASPPGTTLADMARVWGVSPTTVHKAAKRQGWSKALPEDKRPRHGGNRPQKASAIDDVLKWARESTPDEADTVRLLRAENTSLRRKIASTGANAQLVMDAVDHALDGYEPPRLPPPMESPPRGEEEIAVAHLSDTQIGKVTKTYDTEIACGRIAEFGEKVCTIIERHRAYAKVNEVHLYLGGDMVEGELIFPGQAHLIDQSVFDQAVLSGPTAVCRLVLRLLQTVKRVKVVCVCGNHGRPASKHAGSHPRSNWDRVFYHVAQVMTLGANGRTHKDTAGRVEWVNADDFYAVNEVLGHRHLIVHGDQIRGGFGGFPWYGAAKKAQGWIDSVPQEWHTLYFGHFHTYTGGTLNLRRWYCNGTTESDNEYAAEQLAACGRPVQRLQFWNAEHGMVADRPVYLTYGL